MKKAGHRGGTRAKARPKAKRAARAGNTRKSAAKKVVLLSGSNPQIAKGEGNAPGQAYIGAMPDWKLVKVTKQAAAIPGWLAP